MTHRLGNILAQTASGSVIAFGALTALAAWPATAPPANLLADLLHWPLNGTEKIDTPSARLLAAIAGGVMVGWGLTLLMLTRALYLDQPALWARLCLPALAAWFVTDSLGSVLSGAALNVIGNAAFALAFWGAHRLHPQRKRHPA